MIDADKTRRRRRWLIFVPVAAPGEPPMLVSDWQLAQASVRLNPLPERISIVIDGAKFDSSGAPTTQVVASASRIELHVRLNPASAPDKPVLDFAANIAGAT